MAALGLGTASFAGPYGIKGDVAPDKWEEFAILHAAWDAGMECIDTADDYGPQWDVTDWKRVWKTRRVPSVKMLHATPFYAVMLHVPAQVGLVSELHRLKQWGAVEKVGVSAYDREQLWEVGAGSLDIVQAPLNILDARLVPVLRDYHANGIEVHVRSAFLQGALLMDPDHLPPHFDGIRGRLREWHDWREAQGLTTVQAALGPLLSLDFVDVVIVGVNSATQLRELLAVEPLPWTDRWAIDDVNILEPWRWPKS